MEAPQVLKLERPFYQAGVLVPGPAISQGVVSYESFLDDASAAALNSAFRAEVEAKFGVAGLRR